MSRQQGVFLATALLILVIAKDLCAESSFYPSDDERVADSRYLSVKSKGSRRSTQSAVERDSGEVNERVRYGDGPSRFAFGIAFLQNSSLSSNGTDPMPMMGGRATTTSEESLNKDPEAFGLMETATVLNARVGYQLSSVTSLYGNLGGSFQRGIMDPALGVSFQFPINRSVAWLASVQGSLPLSTYSRDVSRITTLTASTGPVYYPGRGTGVFLGAQGFLSYSFYRSSSDGMDQTPQMGGMDQGNMGGMGKMVRGASLMPGGQMDNMTNQSGVTGMDMNSREIMRSGGNAFLGYQFGPSFSANTGGGISASYRDDDMTMWMLDVTVARATYRFEGLSASANFALMSDHMKNDGLLSAPNLPFIGFRLEYVFGNPSTLGSSAGTSCH